MVSILDVKLEHEAAIHTSCDQHVFVFKEIGILNQTYLKRQLSDKDEMLIEDMNVEVCGNYKI